MNGLNFHFVMRLSGEPRELLGAFEDEAKAEKFRETFSDPENIKIVPVLIIGLKNEPLS